MIGGAESLKQIININLNNPSSRKRADVNVRDLTASDKWNALFRLEGEYTAFEQEKQKGIVDIDIASWIPGYDFPYQFASYRIKSREAVKAFYEQRHIGYSNIDARLTSLMYHMGADIEDLVAPSTGMSPEEAYRQYTFMRDTDLRHVA